MGCLDHREARRLRSSLEMMSSSVDGEKLAAVNAVGRILGKHGMRFCDLAPAPVAAAPSPGPWSATPSSPWTPNHRPHEVNLGRQHQVLARALLQTGRPWSEWERGFLTNMTTRNTPSPKEKAKLEELRTAFREASR